MADGRLRIQEVYAPLGFGVFSEVSSTGQTTYSAATAGLRFINSGASILQTLGDRILFPPTTNVRHSYEARTGWDTARKDMLHRGSLHKCSGLVSRLSTRIQQSNIFSIKKTAVTCSEQGAPAKKPKSTSRNSTGKRTRSEGCGPDAKCDPHPRSLNSTRSIHRSDPERTKVSPAMRYHQTYESLTHGLLQAIERDSHVYVLT